MRRPFRRYCFILAERLSMTVPEILERMTAKEISEWMAFDMTRNEEWSKKYEKQQQLEQSRKMTDQQKVAAFKAMLGGK